MQGKRLLKTQGELSRITITMEDFKVSRLLYDRITYQKYIKNDLNRTIR